MKMRIVNCCGDTLAHVNIRQKLNESEIALEQRAIKKARFKQYRCMGCYDDAYRAYQVDEFGQRIWT